MSMTKLWSCTLPFIESECQFKAGTPDPEVDAYIDEAVDLLRA